VRDLERKVETRFERLEAALRAAGEFRTPAEPGAPAILAVECGALHRAAGAGIRTDPHFAASWTDPTH